MSSVPGGCTQGASNGSYECINTSSCNSSQIPSLKVTNASDGMNFTTLAFSFNTGANTVNTTPGSYYGTVNPSGISILSNGTKSTIHASIRKLAAHYLPARIKNNAAIIVACGISYCAGQGCVPNIALPTSNVIDKVVYTSQVCNIEVCISPHTETDHRLESNTPVTLEKQPNTPYTLKFFVLDGNGTRVSWVCTVTYEPA